MPVPAAGTLDSDIPARFILSAALLSNAQETPSPVAAVSCPERCSDNLLCSAASTCHQPYVQFLAGHVHANK